ncbi:MAG: hypothetical protein U0325_33755 [Polyangiales bacterium]
MIDDDDPPPTGLSLTDEEGHPLAGQRFLLTFGDGSVRSGVTDGEGRATLHLEEDAEVLFPDLGAVRSG